MLLNITEEFEGKRVLIETFDVVSHFPPLYGSSLGRKASLVVPSTIKEVKGRSK